MGVTPKTVQSPVDRHRNELDRATANLLSLWTGAASEAWGRTQADWQSDLGEMTAAAAELSSAVRQAANAYRDVDDAVARAWSI
ncbi:WXG100 family type VII secretion target [Microbacterium sp.]|uniref:WXG100 family type VII secretion target n=1 Tax=Microbacterium sp. TaxID=51671 RepID=UPI0039E6CEBF